LLPQGRGQFWPQGHKLNNFGRGPLDNAIYQIILKLWALKFQARRFLKIAFWKPIFLTLWPTYATNWNNLKNISREPSRDHSCEVWSKSNKRFQRRRCLSKTAYARRKTDDRRQRTKTSHNSSLCAQVS